MFADVGEFEKDMAEEQEEAAALAAEEAALTESSRQLLGGTHTIAEPLDIEACIHRFIEKNNGQHYILSIVLFCVFSLNLNFYSAWINYSRQNLTSRFSRLKSILAL